ncbi:MAG: stage II sporulation protein R [Bacilli bacterium]|nr:stage II sporulation protein R [Bacilli bacterium]
MKKIVILLLSFLSIVYISNNYKESENIIPDSAIRFRVIANSNSVYDQNIKIQVRNTIQNELLKLTNDKKSIEEVRNTIKKHQKELYDIVNNKLIELKYDKEFNIDYGYNYFPKKDYKGIEYKEGYYESLVITLGDGEGDNFWCVLFPPLCLLEVEESNTSDVEYKFFVKEIIDKFFNN